MKIGLIALVFVTGGTASHLGPGDHNRTLLIGKQERSYLVHVPPGYERHKGMPVVLAFHGATMNAQMMVEFSGLNRKADQAGFVVVYPNGRWATWNAGGQRFNREDDVAFVAKIIDDLETVITVDKKRVFACGMSNGAMMCYRLAAELSERIAAIAPVAGTLAVDNMQPKRPVPVIHFHGSDDALVPPGGPNKKLPLLIQFKSLDDTIQTMVKTAHCRPEPVINELANTAPDNLPVIRKTYQGGTNGAEVVLYLIEGGGHTWPGMNNAAPFLGKSTLNISANDLMWDFFQKHPLK